MPSVGELPEDSRLKPARRRAIKRPPSLISGSVSPEAQQSPGGQGRLRLQDAAAKVIKATAVEESIASNCGASRLLFCEARRLLHESSREPVQEKTPVSLMVRAAGCIRKAVRFYLLKRHCCEVFLAIPAEVKKRRETAALRIHEQQLGGDEEDNDADDSDATDHDADAQSVLHGFRTLQEEERAMLVGTQVGLLAEAFDKLNDVSGEDTAFASISRAIQKCAGTILELRDSSASHMSQLQVLSKSLEDDQMSRTRIMSELEADMARILKALDIAKEPGIALELNPCRTLASHDDTKFEIPGRCLDIIGALEELNFTLLDKKHRRTSPVPQDPEAPVLVTPKAPVGRKAKRPKRKVDQPTLAGEPQQLLAPKVPAAESSANTDNCGSQLMMSEAAQEVVPGGTAVYSAAAQSVSSEIRTASSRRGSLLASTFASRRRSSVLASTGIHGVGPDGFGAMRSSQLPSASTMPSSATCQLEEADGGGISITSSHNSSSRSSSSNCGASRSGSKSSSISENSSIAGCIGGGSGSRKTSGCNPEGVGLEAVAEPAEACPVPCRDAMKRSNTEHSEPPDTILQPPTLPAGCLKAFRPPSATRHVLPSPRQRAAPPCCSTEWSLRPSSAASEGGFWRFEDSSDCDVQHFCTTPNLHARRQLRCIAALCSQAPALRSTEIAQSPDVGAAPVMIEGHKVKYATRERMRSRSDAAEASTRPTSPHSELEASPNTRVEASTLSTPPLPLLSSIPSTVPSPASTTCQFPVCSKHALGQDVVPQSCRDLSPSAGKECRFFSLDASSESRPGCPHVIAATKMQRRLPPANIVKDSYRAENPPERKSKRYTAPSGKPTFAAGGKLPMTFMHEKRQSLSGILFVGGISAPGLG